MRCPRCGQETPANEAAAYGGWHEDCSVAGLPPCGASPVEAARRFMPAAPQGEARTAGDLPAFAGRVVAVF